MENTLIGYNSNMTTDSDHNQPLLYENSRDILYRDEKEESILQLGKIREKT
jgi:hypothetical protein